MNLGKLGSAPRRAWWWLKGVETCSPEIVFYILCNKLLRFDWYFILCMQKESDGCYMQHEAEQNFSTTRTSAELLVRLKENERLMIRITKCNCAHDKEGLAFHSRDTNNNAVLNWHVSGYPAAHSQPQIVIFIDSRQQLSFHSPVLGNTHLTFTGSRQ
jgi:hypothetical protein